MAPIASVSFPALGSSARICVQDPKALQRARQAVEQELLAIDNACSRFREDSELMCINQGGGEPVAVGELLFEAVAAALRGAKLTSGCVDPTVGRNLRLAGYDCDFALIARRDPRTFRPRFAKATGWSCVELDEDERAVRVPAGIELDLGATAKALAADRSAAAANAATGSGVLVSLGGDVSVAGPAPIDGWAIRIAPDHSADIHSPGPAVAIFSGGLASSGTAVRRWKSGVGELHHIVDPRTGRPADTPWQTVTVAARTCLDANIASTAAIVLGSEGPRWLEERGLPARLAGCEGKVVRVSGWPEEES